MVMIISHLQSSASTSVQASINPHQTKIMAGGGFNFKRVSDMLSKIQLAHAVVHQINKII